MPDHLPPDKPPNRPTTQANHDGDAYGRFRRGLDEASRQEAPRLPRGDLSATIVALLLAIGLAFGPWTHYTLDDGTTVTRYGIRGDGLGLVLFALLAIGALAVASRREPGHAATPALIALGCCVAGLIAPAYRMMDPGIYQANSLANPVGLTRGWGLIGCFLVMLVATIGAFRVWRIADVF